MKKSLGTKLQFCKRLGILVMVLVVGMAVVGCEDETIGDGPEVVTYAGTSGEYIFVLQIIDNSRFILTVDGKTSTGTALYVNDMWELTPDGADEPFYVTVDSSGGITEIDGTIEFTDGSDPMPGPGTVTPTPPNVVIGGFTWLAYSDESDGGTSTINMTQGTGNESNRLTFTGNVARIPGQTYGFAGWSCTPDSSTLASLKTTDAISFKVADGSSRFYIVEVQTSDITDYSHYRSAFYFYGSETINIQYSELYSPGWGQSDSGVPFNINNITGINFQVRAEDDIGNFQITIWDLIAGQAPETIAGIWSGYDRSSYDGSHVRYTISENDGSFTFIQASMSMLEKDWVDFARGNVDLNGLAATFTYTAKWDEATSGWLSDSNAMEELKNSLGGSLSLNGTFFGTSSGSTLSVGSNTFTKE